MNPTPPKPPADAFYAALTPDKTHSIASKADALPEVKALEPARITDARILVAALNDSSDLCLLAAGVIADWEKDQRIAQLETSLRSSEAALATLYHDWKEKCIEADTMRQHFKVAEELLAEARRENAKLLHVEDTMRFFAKENTSLRQERDEAVKELKIWRGANKRADDMKHYGVELP